MLLQLSWNVSSNLVIIHPVLDFLVEFLTRCTDIILGRMNHYVLIPCEHSVIKSLGHFISIGVVLVHPRSVINVELTNTAPSFQIPTVRMIAWV